MKFYILLLLLFLKQKTADENQQQNGKNNVCKHLDDYKTMATNKNCWYNPDVGADADEMIRRHGYVFEEHEVTTKDGYILKLYRLPPKRSLFQFKSKAPIIMHHGFAAASNIWFIQGKNSLVFFLVNKGYDIWLTNMRGSKPSQKHKTLQPSDIKFWDFCMDDVAFEDLPATIEYVTTITRRKPIFIGHSLGGTLAYMYTSEMVEHSKKYLRGVITFTPIAYTKNLEGITSALQFVIKSLHTHLMALPNDVDVNPLLKMFNDRICAGYPGTVQCTMQSRFTTGSVEEQHNDEVMPIFFSQFPSGTSMKILKQFVGLIASGDFQHYDYGLHGNLQHYGSLFPPEYDVGKISVPQVIFVGTEDPVSTIKDAELLAGKMSPHTKVVIKHVNFGHLDFTIGANMKQFHEELLKSIVDLESN